MPCRGSEGNGLHKYDCMYCSTGGTCHVIWYKSRRYCDNGTCTAALSAGSRIYRPALLDTKQSVPVIVLLLCLYERFVALESTYTYQCPGMIDPEKKLPVKHCGRYLHRPTPTTTTTNTTADLLLHAAAKIGAFVVSYWLQALLLYQVPGICYAVVV